MKKRTFLIFMSAVFAVLMAAAIPTGLQPGVAMAATPPPSVTPTQAGSRIISALTATGLSARFRRDQSAPSQSMPAGRGTPLPPWPSLMPMAPGRMAAVTATSNSRYGNGCHYRYHRYKCRFRVQRSHRRNHRRTGVDAAATAPILTRSHRRHPQVCRQSAAAWACRSK